MIRPALIAAHTQMTRKQKQQMDTSAYGRAFQAVDRFGFPAVVAAVLLWFLLFHVVPSTEDLATAINRNSNAIHELNQTAQAQTDTYRTLEQAVRKSMDVSEESNTRLRQMMGDAPYPMRRPPR